ncbi:MAG TPA: efflux RND transporter periplasmic adaptor subunit [Vicinamibacterales bacterium]|nr:efflux RND transporter periplasmic adaptor subunit [Vicinamibacterales bacterium]
MRRLIVLIVVFVAATAGVVGYLKFYRIQPAPLIITAAAARGDITEAAVATGTISALRTVDVGTQVSGIVKKLYVDFNSIVHKDELIAELDPANAQEEVDQAEASRERAEIDLEQADAALDIDRRNFDRAVSLRTRELDTQQDLDQATLQVKEDEAVIKQDQAAISIADANLEQAKVDLGYCTIRSPIDGVVISRNVDEGQTVAARLAAPTLYVLATDLTHLQLVADVDESDVSRIRAGQTVTFTVDAYAGRQFPATVTSVRLNATSTNNVVTYQVVIDVPNPDLRLMPGMTATVDVKIWQVNDVLRVQSAALRFRPSDDVFAAFGQPVPPEARMKPGVGGRAMTTAVADHPVSDKPVVGTQGGIIDEFYQPVPRPSASGLVWVMDQGRLKPVEVRTGITDGTWTELTDGGIQEGDAVVTNIILPAMLHKAPVSTSNPLMPPGRGAGLPRPNGR